MNGNVTTPATNRRRIPGRILFILACLATLLAGFYTVENIRGRRAWETCRHELEAKGALLDWAAYIPPPVPDEENIFKAPGMAQWFVKNSMSEMNQPYGPGHIRVVPPVVGLPSYGNTNAVLIAELKAAMSETESPSANREWRLDSLKTETNRQRFVSDFIGKTGQGSQGHFVFVQHPFDEIKPVHILIRASEPVTSASIKESFPSNKDLPGTSRLSVESSGSNSFQVWLTPPAWIGASNYIAWTDQSRSNLDRMRSALKRAHARIEGDYQHPFEMPIVNFIALRNVAQTLAQRAECFLLVGQPENALSDLTLLHDLCRLLKAEPAGKPMPLISAMVYVAISALYSQTIAEGLRLQAWHERELVTLQEQIKAVNLLLPFIQAAETERAMFCGALESSGLDGIIDLLSGKDNSWRRIKNPRYLAWKSMPRGWVYQNMVTTALMKQKLIESIDLTRKCLLPARVEAYVSELQAGFGSYSPYQVLANIAVPNYLRASQTVARNQTLINQAYIACALERFHTRNDKYPDNLDALVPGFAESLPHEVINDQPYKYRIGPGDKFVLYSVGWNEKDNGGVPGTALSNGDWVWGSTKP
jgi:hypothetical protein